MQCQYPNPNRTRTRTRNFFQYPNPIRPEVENTYPLDPGSVSWDLVNCSIKTLTLLIQSCFQISVEQGYAADKGQLLQAPMHLCSRLFLLLFHTCWISCAAHVKDKACETHSVSATVTCHHKNSFELLSFSVISSSKTNYRIKRLLRLSLSPPWY